MGKRSTWARGIATMAIAWAASAEEPAPTPWRPLAVGLRASYDVVLEEEREGRAKLRSRRVARLVEEVSARGAPPSTAPDWYELRTERRSPAVGGDVRRAARSWLSVEAGALVERARSGDGDLSPRRHPEPLLWLPRVLAPGSHWRVGRLALPEGSLELHGEVTGTSDVETPAGHFEDCLEVRYVGAPEEPPSPANPAGPRLASVRFESREWLARGVGPVQLAIEREIAWLDEDGAKHTRRLRERRTLRAWSGPEAAAIANEGEHR